MDKQDSIKLTIPRQELDHGSYFDCEETAVEQWIAQLPMANLGQATRQLYQSIAELNTVKILPAKRLALLELLRPPIYLVSRGLSKHYLNQPIALPQRARKVAKLTHNLHHQLATGYTIVATHATALGSRPSFSKPDVIIATALHRAMSDHSINIRRHYQLYQSVEAGVWRSLHQFFNLSRQVRILNKVIDDTELGNCSIEDNYIRALLLGSCRPNQLRQEDLRDFFEPLTRWASKCTLQETHHQSLFVVDPDGDKPPVYRELVDESLYQHWYGLNTTELIIFLRSLVDAVGPNALIAEDHNSRISYDMLQHLIKCWGTLSTRTFIRMANTDKLDISIGLSATHHFVSGMVSFESLIDKRGAQTFSVQQENPFLKTPNLQRKKDVWDSAYDSNLGKMNVSLEAVDYHIRRNDQKLTNSANEKYHNHSVQVINSSSHGYCIAWPSQATASIKSGEIVGIKPYQSANWSIGVIRWVSHDNNSEALLGLELICPNASPYGARIVRKTGDMDRYVRTLVLPEVAVTNTPATLITPRVPFRVGHKVVLNQNAKEIQVQLTKKINDFGAYNQFEFRRIKSIKPLTGEADNENDDFDSLWRNL